MPINQETLNRRLYKVLHNRFKDTKGLDSEGDVSPIEDDADVFRFTFVKDDKKYGTVYVTVDNSKTLKIYYDDDVTDSPSVISAGSQYNDTWYGFTEFLKRWAMSNQLGWEPTDKDHLEGDMARRNHVKKQENMMEGYYPMGKKASYSDAIPSVKMVIQHTREIQEGEQRYRNVAKIFLENNQGERILAPTTKPGIAKVYARHIAEGGLPHDDRWNHIKGLCEEYSKMAGFVRATRGKQFNESAQGLIESGINHYSALRESLSKMAGHRGYNMYFESWTPPLMEDDTDTSSINELFVQETMDPRIESVMPILSKLHKPVAEMREIGALAEWADSLVEGPSVTAQQTSDSPAMRGSPALAHYAAQLDSELDEDESLTSNNPVGIPEGYDDEDLAEDLGPEQKRVGQLGPTEKVKNNNIGKLVGANENFINTSVQAVATEGKSDDPDYDKSLKRFKKGLPPKGKQDEPEYMTDKNGMTVPVKSKKDGYQIRAEKKKVAEGQNDLDAILRIIKK